MIYLTGDTHGDFRRFSTKHFPEQKQMTRDDFLIILGDFGGVFNDSAEEHYWLDWLAKKNFTLLFLDGNHENFELLAEYLLINFHGGKARQIRENIFYLCRGHIFHLDGKDFFVMGGAQSHDAVILTKERQVSQKMLPFLRHSNIPLRMEGVNWWPQELPASHEIQWAHWNLEQRNSEAPLYILSHCASFDIQSSYFRDYPDNLLTHFFMLVQFEYPYEAWFCGHYHVNQRIDYAKLQVLYDKIIPLNEERR